MPQVHNKSILSHDSTGFSKHSRYNASLRFTDSSLKKVKVLNALEQRVTRVKLNYFDRHAGIYNNKVQRMRNRLIENSNKRMAYKLVLKHHSIQKAKDYQKALDGKYSFDALYGEVKDMLVFMRPDAIRERKANALVEENRRRYMQVLQKNKDDLDRIFPPPKKWEPIDFSKIGKKDEDEESEKEEEKPLAKIDLRNKLALANLRRRVIAIDSKPNSPLKTPSISKPPTAKTAQGGKRQGITMEMMKKQKSFIEVQGKLDIIETKPDAAETNTTDEQKLASNEPELKLRLEGANEESNDTAKQGNLSAKTSDTGYVSAKTSDTGRKRRSSRRSFSTEDSLSSNRQPLLPPIPKSNSVPKPPKMKTGSDKLVKLPVLKMSKNESESIAVTS